MSHRYLILGLLMERPMSGYDIRKHVKAALNAVTNASYGTLYPTLHKLLEEGAVEMREIPQQGRPAKKLYQITRAGRKELVEWLKQPPVADQIRREFLLKLYLAKNLGSRELRRLVEDRRDATAELLRALEAERSEADDPHQAWVVDYALSLYQAEMEWLERFEAQISVA